MHLRFRRCCFISYISRCGEYWLPRMGSMIRGRKLPPRANEMDAARAARLFRSALKARHISYMSNATRAYPPPDHAADASPYTPVSHIPKSGDVVNRPRRSHDEVLAASLAQSTPLPLFRRCDRMYSLLQPPRWRKTFTSDASYRIVLACDDFISKPKPPNCSSRAHLAQTPPLQTP